MIQYFHGLFDYYFNFDHLIIYITIVGQQVLKQVLHRIPMVASLTNENSMPACNAL